MKRVSDCRCCGGENLHRYLDLGEQPLANSYHKGETLERYPLEVDVCRECFHSQLSVVIDPKIMFEHYLYVSGTTLTFRLHCKELARDAVARSKSLSPRVLDVACNDGLLLECFRSLNCDVQGVDPSVNLREYTREKGIPVEVDYWSETVADRVGTFDIITATNVFAHVDDADGFLKACGKALNPGGFVAIEFPYCEDMIAKCEFDTIYHEHLSYFLVNSFRRLTRRRGFEIFDIVQTPIHGCSIRFFIRPSDGGDCPAVGDLIAEEGRKGMLDVATYDTFGAKVAANKESFLKEVEEQRKTRKVVGYGASAKGNTMLNFFGLKLDYIVDDNKLKHGHMTPGMDIPVVAPAALADEDGPLAVVILSWNFGKEIAKKIVSLRPDSKGDVCLLYVPETKVLLPMESDETLSAISG